MRKFFVFLPLFLIACSLQDIAAAITVSPMPATPQAFTAPRPTATAIGTIPVPKFQGLTMFPPDIQRSAPPSGCVPPREHEPSTTQFKEGEWFVLNKVGYFLEDRTVIVFLNTPEGVVVGIQAPGKAMENWVITPGEEPELLGWARTDEVVIGPFFAFRSERCGVIFNDFHTRPLGPPRPTPPPIPKGPSA